MYGPYLVSLGDRTLRECVMTDFLPLFLHEQIHASSNGVGCFEAGFACLPVDFSLSESQLKLFLLFLDCLSLSCKEPGWANVTTFITTTVCWFL